MASEIILPKLDKIIQPGEMTDDTADVSREDPDESAEAKDRQEDLVQAEILEERTEETLEEKLVAAIEELERKLAEASQEMTKGIITGDNSEKPDEPEESKYQEEINPDPRFKKVRATPAARRIAREYKMDIQKMIGSGPNGRIEADDVKKMVVIIPGKSSYKSREPVVIGTALDVIIGNQENVFKKPEKIEKKPGNYHLDSAQKLNTGVEPTKTEETPRKKIKDMNQKIAKVPNPKLDFVPFVEEVLESIDAVVMKKNSEMDFVPFVDSMALPLREAIIVKPMPINPLKRKRTENQKQESSNVKNKAIEKVEPECVEPERIETERVETESIKVESSETTVKESNIDETVVPATPSETIEKKAENKMTFTEKRKMIADCMVKSNLETAVITLTTEIDMSEVKELRKKITKKTEEQAKYRCTYTDFLLMAVARALMKHPIINSSLEEPVIIENPFVHIGLAVSMDDGLILPVIKNAQELNFVEMVNRRGEMLKSIKNKHFCQDDLKGSTFTITNLGMYGILEFTAIINQPNSAILSVGEVVQRIRVHQGDTVVRSVMRVSLNLDHRVADGMAGAKFLQDIKADMENPSLLLF